MSLPTVRSRTGVTAGLPTVRSRTGAAAGLLALVLAVLLLPAAPAQAHAILERTAPAQDSVVATAPHRLTLRFSEDVTAAADALRAYDSAQRPVRLGPSQAHGKAVSASFPGRVRPGTYTVSWHVVSADSHPVSGQFTFSIGHPSAVTHHGDLGTHTDRTVGVLMTASRFAGYAGIVLSLGIIAVVLGLWPQGRVLRRVRRLVWTGWWLLVAGAAGGFLLQGPYGVGRSLGALLDPGLLQSTAHSRYGTAVLGRLSVLLVLGVLLLVALSGLGETGALALGIGICALSILVSVGLAGHAGDGSVWSPAMLADVAHVAAMGVWMGGLVLLVTGLRSRDMPLEQVLPRFSRWALVSYAVIAASGTFRAWQTVGAWAALPDTLYGRLLLGKIGGFVLLGVLGEAARRWVRHRRRDSGHLAGLRAEVGIGAAVLVLTSVLVGTAQAKESYAPTRTVTSATATTQVALTADPAHSGVSTLRVAVTGATGSPQAFSGLSATVSCPDKGVAPLPVHFSRTGTGTARAAATFSVPGTWIVDLSVRTGPVQQTDFRLRIPVR